MLKILSFVVILASTVPVFSQLPQKFFPIDSFMRPRVDFWKKVFTKLNSFEGFIHDDEDLRIIYSQIEFKSMDRRRRIRFVRDEKRKIKRILTSIIKKRKKNLTPDEQELLEQIGDPSLEVLRKMPHQVRFQQGMRDRYFQGLKRSYLYLDKIKSVFQEMNLPIELSYLPHVESSFNYLAYSKVGAAGIWQFMRSTGRIYKLNLSYIIDERRDPIKATYAAAKLLRDNYRKLNSWPLALTAYNHGARSMEMAIKGVGTTDISQIIQEYKGRRFGFASKNFYASFAAAAEIAQNPDLYFGEIEKQTLPEFSELMLEKSLTVNQIIKALRIDLKTFKEFNLAIRPIAYRNSLSLPKGFQVKIPKASEEELKTYQLALSQIQIKKKNLIASGDHTVSPGESLYMISQIYKISLSDLIAINKIANPSRVYPGMKLKIPGDDYQEKKQRQTTLLAHIETPAKQEINQELLKKEEDEQIQKEDKLIASSQENENDSIEVEKNEVVEEEKETLWNKVSSFFTVQIKTHQPKKQVLAKKEEPSNKEETKEKVDLNSEDIFKDYDFDVIKVSPNVHEIIVETEETMGHYSDWLIKNSSKIRALNGKRNNSILIGQKLKLPMDEEEVVSFNIKRVQYHQMIEQDFYENYHVDGTTEYKVKRGDTLLGISQKLEVPLWLMKKTFKSQGLSIGPLQIGQILPLPEVRSVTNQNE